MLSPKLTDFYLKLVQKIRIVLTILVIFFLCLSGYFLYLAGSKSEDFRYVSNFIRAEKFGFYTYYALIGVVIFMLIESQLSKRFQSESDNNNQKIL